jgi:hypothetical protein
MKISKKQLTDLVKEEISRQLKTKQLNEAVEYDEDMAYAVGEKLKNHLDELKEVVWDTKQEIELIEKLWKKGDWAALKRMNLITAREEENMYSGSDTMHPSED